jgi:hypothetical protein
VCARHALALASLVARDPSGCGSFISAVEPLLRHNVEAAKRTGGFISSQTRRKGFNNLSWQRPGRNKVRNSERSRNHPVMSNEDADVDIAAVAAS